MIFFVGWMARVAAFGFLRRGEVLFGDHVGVLAVLDFEEFVVGTLFDDSAVPEAKDAVAGLDCGQAVCDGEHGAVDVVESALDELLGLGIPAQQ